MRLIDAYDVIKAVDKHTNNDGVLDDDITCILEEVSTVDVKQTNTAEWKIVGKTTFHYECSICGGAGDKWDKFCKHCGRKMTNAVAE